jgi:hypothetical protein
MATDALDWWTHHKAAVLFIAEQCKKYEEQKTETAKTEEKEV